MIDIDVRDDRMFANAADDPRGHGRSLVEREPDSNDPLARDDCCASRVGFGNPQVWTVGAGVRIDAEECEVSVMVPHNHLCGNAPDRIEGNTKRPFASNYVVVCDDQATQGIYEEPAATL